MPAQTGRAIVCAALALEADILTRRFEGESCEADIASIADFICRAAGDGCRGIVSYGVAGGLSPLLRSGDIVVGSEIVSRRERLPTDDVWSAWLLSAMPTAVYGPIAGMDIPIRESAARVKLWLASGALSADMESHVIARLAAANAMRFVALRVIIDAVGRNVPQTALACISNDGGTSQWQLSRQLLARPGDTLDVIRLWADWWPARKALLNCSEVLGASVRAIEL